MCCNANTISATIRRTVPSPYGRPRLRIASKRSPPEQNSVTRYKRFVV